jgi:hypothetical protein
MDSFNNNDFKIGDRVKRISKKEYDSLKYSIIDDIDEGYLHTGTIIHISEEGYWPPGNTTRLLPKLYFVNFNGNIGGVGIIKEQLELVIDDKNLKIGDNVIIDIVGKNGIITKLWKGSDLEKKSGHYDLDKYFVKFDDMNSGWYYKNNIVKYN